MMMGRKCLDREGINITDEQRSYQVIPLILANEGVKELFEAAKPLPPSKKLRSELQKSVDADYYGYRDEDDGALIEYEESQEEVAMAKTMREAGGEPAEGWTPIGNVSEIPRQPEVEQYLVERRKRRLMERYGM
jgi:pre-mRNA-splicing factor ISY1